MALEHHRHWKPSMVQHLRSVIQEAIVIYESDGRIKETVTCPWTSADECAMARERSVAGKSNDIPACPVHGAYTDTNDGLADAVAQERDLDATIQAEERSGLDERDFDPGDAYDERESGE